MKVEITVNGRARTIDAAPNLLLVQAIRENLKLTGTHVGCDTAQCGACTVILNGNAVKSCNVLLAQAQGAQVTTIEGLADADGTMHPMQSAFKDCHGLQCGFCTPGILMASKALLDANPDPTESEARYWLAGNLCRCTGYDKIIKAVLDTAAELRQDRKSA